jgi:AcrR family transcriptional regulator
MNRDTPKRRRREGPARQPLDRRRIAEAALACIDAEGLEQLSMRRLGAGLGVEAMALYHHFRNKAELLDGVLELLLEEIDPPPPETGTPMARLRRTFEATRVLASRHPHAFLLLPTRRLRTEAALIYYERLLGLFREAGFDAAASARCFRLLAGYVIGAVLAEIGGRALQPDATPVLLAGFSDPEHFPLVTQVVPELRVANLDAIFQFGMDIIFEGIERYRRGGA